MTLPFQILHVARVLFMGAVFAAARHAVAAPCAAEDFTTRVSGSNECVVIATAGPPTTPSKTLVVWLHGDHSGGGAATSHERPAREVASRFGAEGVVSVALWRPGYADSQGNASGGDLNNRSDHYTERNVTIVADAIARLKEHWHPARTVLVGHSGGAATIAIALGMRPALADAALLLSCPCDLRAWRARRSWWPRSEDPAAWAPKVGQNIRVLALTGDADDNTSPSLAQKYVSGLAERGVDARFEPVPGANHNSILGDPKVMDAVGALLK